MQLSINADKPLDYHVDLGARLADLRSRGVLIIGSGNIVHNLAAMDGQLGDNGFGWAARFDNDAADLSHATRRASCGYDEHRDYAAAVPTPDHFIPMLYFAGLSSAQDSGADVLVDGYAYGSLSMTSYTLFDPRREPLSTHETPGSAGEKVVLEVPVDASDI